MIYLEYEKEQPHVVDLPIVIIYLTTLAGQASG